MTDETTRLRALLERAELPWAAMKDFGDEFVGDDRLRMVVLCPHVDTDDRDTVATIDMGHGEECDEAHAALIVGAVNALPGLLDAAERAEREHGEAGESTRAAWRESERREQELRGRLIAAERERDDLAAVLETRTAEHALAMARVREMEAIIAGRSKPPTDDELVAMETVGLRLARRWHAVDKAGNVRAWPAAEVSRG